MPLSFVSWNVNGLRACMGKGFGDFVSAGDFDIIALQETKMQPEQADFTFPDYHCYWNSAQRKGYSGTLILTKTEPLNAACGMNIPEHDTEGRVITLEFPAFYFVTVYTPNAQRDLLRLDYRMEWDDAFRSYLLGLSERKPVISCGDFNVAHKEIDLAHPKTNQKNAGFTPQEREKMTALLDSGFTDTYRLLYPDKTGAYSWWTFMSNARQRNVGWRIDYFIVSERLAAAVREATIMPAVMGSDHCPVGLVIDI